MADTLDNLRAEIARLEKQAEQMEIKEKKLAIQEIKTLIRKYDISAAEIGLDKKAPAKRTTRAKRKTKAKRKTAKSATVYQYGDLSWSGRGRKPQWAKDILEAEGEG